MSEQITTPTPGAQPPAEPTPAAAPADKTFTQADLDRIVRERLERQKQQYADYDQLKTAAQKLQELEQGQLSEREKLEKQIEKLTQRATAAEALAAEREQRANESLIESAVIREATRLGFNDPEDAYIILTTKPPTGVTRPALGNDGQPAGVAEAVTALAQSRPYLLRQGLQQPRIPAQEPFNPAGPTGQFKETNEQRRARIYGRRGRDHDPAEAQRRGGGVIWPNGKPE